MRKWVEAFAIPVAPHDTHNINVHLVAAIPNGLTVEYFAKEADIMKDAELYQETLTPKDGLLYPPNKPGLSIELMRKPLTG